MTKEKLLALFTLAPIPVDEVYELANGYWPRHPDYYKLIIDTPWWLVKTPTGLIKVGWRKRVINIDWSDTPGRLIVTTDNVTKDETYVHAHTYDKALEYMRVLASLLNPLATLKLRTEAEKYANIVCYLCRQYGPPLRQEEGTALHVFKEGQNWGTKGNRTCDAHFIYHHLWVEEERMKD